MIDGVIREPMKIDDEREIEYQNHLEDLQYSMQLAEFPG